jgi:hypothetical protein
MDTGKPVAEANPSILRDAPQSPRLDKIEDNLWCVDLLLIGHP